MNATKLSRKAKNLLQIIERSTNKAVSLTYAESTHPDGLKQLWAAGLLMATIIKGVTAEGKEHSIPAVKLA